MSTSNRGCRYGEEFKRTINDIEALKTQMMDMQMEIDILKETINVLKKTPASIRKFSAIGRRQ